MGVVNALVLLFCIVLVCSNPTPHKYTAEKTDYILPKTVVPSKYTISLTFPELAFSKDGNEFEGKVAIDFTVGEEVKEIKLHASNSFIVLKKVTVEDMEVAAEKYSIDPTTDILTISTDTLETNKELKMTIEYTGTISNTDNYGIYKSSYAKSATETVYLLATQFEATYARRAFPCFDEPSFKATFDVTVTYPPTKTVLFNTEQSASPEITDGISTVIFKTTPKMSSYLFALVVSDFTSTKGTNVEGDTVSYAVWSRDNAKTSRAYAVEIGPKIAQKLNEYTGRLYGNDMKKIDQIALPDLAAGAMENWGLITYRENYLLSNPDDSSATAKKAIAKIIAHELAHQWFGNIITCDWWSATFLNEGFATYFEYFISNQVETTWGLDQQYVVDVVQSALQSDAVADSQALESEVYTPAEIADKFGDISYRKGGSIIRMVTHILGEAQFQAGIKEYFNTAELLHSTSTPAKLWEALQKHVKTDVSGFPQDATLATIMKNWIEKPGYPVLTVTLEGKSLKISQERFLVEGTSEDIKWSVPITYADSKDKKFEDTKPAHWLTDKETTITLENDIDWIILNSQQTGYYRVNYDDNLWTKIAAALQKDEFDGIVDLNRAQIVDDLFNLAKANKIKFSDVFNRIAFLKSDTFYYPWVPAISGFNYMMQRIPKDNELRPYIEAQLLGLMDALYKSVSFEELEDKAQVDTLKQILATTWACALGKDDCVSKAKEAFTDTGTKLNKNLKGVIYCTALKNSTDLKDYEKLWALYGTSDDSTEKLVILNSLGCSNSKDKLKELLEETVKEQSVIKGQDALGAFLSVLGGSEEGVDVALDFFAEKLTDIVKKYTSMGAHNSLVTNLGAKLSKDTQITKFKSVIESASFPADLKQAGEKALTQAQSNVKWLSDHSADLKKFYTGEEPDEPQPSGANAIYMNSLLVTLVSLSSLLGFLRT